MKKNYTLWTHAPAADYGIMNWRTSSRAYAKRKARELTRKERENGFLMSHEAVEVKSDGTWFAV